MGFFSNTVMFAAGLGLGYYCCKSPSAQLTTSQRVAALEQKYGTLPGQQGIAGPRELSIDYVVDEKHGFKGYVFHDNASSNSGVLVRKELFGKSYFFTYANVEGGVQAPTEKVSLICSIPLADVPQTKSDTVTSLWYRFRNTVDDVVE